MRPSKRHRLEKKRRELSWRPSKRVDPLLAQRLVEGQRPGFAMLAGAVVALAGAMVWTIVALSTTFVVELLAIGIGAACEIECVERLVPGGDGLQLSPHQHTLPTNGLRDGFEVTQDLHSLSNGIGASSAAYTFRLLMMVRWD